MPDKKELEFKIDYVLADTIEKTRLVATNPLLIIFGEKIKNMYKGDGYFISAFDIQKAGYTSAETFRSALNRHLDQKKIERGDLRYTIKKCSTEKLNGKLKELGLYVYVPS